MSIKKTIGSNLTVSEFNQHINKDILISKLIESDKDIVYGKYYFIKDDITIASQINQLVQELKDTLTPDYSFYYGITSLTKFIVLDIIFFNNTVTPSLQQLESQLKIINELSGYLYKHSELIPYPSNDNRIEIILINRLNPLIRVMITIYDEVDSIYKLEITQNIIKKLLIENIDLLVNI